MTQRFSTFLLGAVCATMLAAVPAAALDLGGHDRDGTVFGLNLGAGWNKIKFDDEIGTKESNTVVDFSGGISFGWAPNDNFIGSIGVYGWRAGWVMDYYDVTARNYNFMLDVCWFPRGEGFWLKGGLGYGILDFYQVRPLTSVTIQQGDLALVGGAGYEFRVSDQAAVGVSWEYRYLGFDQFEDLTNVELTSNNWFFSMRFYIM